MSKLTKDDSTQIQLLSIDVAIDLSFIYEKVKHPYKLGGRKSIDPIILIEVVMIQYIFGIRLMRQTMKEI